ncbi:hypothetical protein GCM10028832_07360 [Streptomyces sparsus]
MSTNPLPALKSQSATSGQPHVAAPGPAASNGGALKVVAEGVPAAVRPDPHPGNRRYPVAWLRITAPRGATPTAASWCECGWSRRAFGQTRVLSLVTDHADHREHCPLRVPQEGRAAA